MRTIQQMVQSEVRYCVSELIETLIGAPALNGLGGQAMELAAPILDYEEAGLQAGWKTLPDDTFQGPKGHHWASYRDTPAERWEQLCDDLGIDPVESEVCEFWAVSSWMAEQLASRGERVDRDFAGMEVWARRNSGQGIDADAIMGRIYLETHREG